MGTVHRWVAPFQGLQTKLHQLHVREHEWLMVENASMDIRGAFGCAPGYELLSTQTLDGDELDLETGESLFYRGEELLAVWGRRLYSYVEATGTWADKGPWTRGVLKARQIVDSPAEQTEPDASEVAGIGVAMWSESTGLYYRVYTSESKSVLTENALIDASWNRPRVIALGDRLVMLANDGSGTIMAALVRADAPTATLSWTAVITTAPGDPHYDARTESDATFLVATTNGGLVEVHRIDQELGVIGSGAFTPSTPPVGPVAISPAPEGSVDDEVCVAYARTTGSIEVAWLSDSLSLSRGPSVYTSSTGIFNLSLTPYGEATDASRGQCLMSIEQRDSIASVDEWRSRVEYVNVSQTAGTTMLFTTIGTQYGAALGAHGCLCDGEIYQPLVYPGVTDGGQGSVYVVQAPTNRPDSTSLVPPPGEIMARGYEFGRAAGYRENHHLGTTTVSGMTFSFAARYRTRFKILPTDTTYFAQTAVGQMAIDLTRRSCTPAHLAGSIWAAMAGELRCYDGGMGACEAGYHVVPEFVTVVSNVAGNVAIGTYTIAAVYEDVDEQDRLVVSGIARTSHEVSGGSRRIDVTVTSLRLTGRRSPRQGVRIHLFMSEAGSVGRLYRVTSLTAPPLNSVTQDSQTIAINVNTSAADWFDGRDTLYTDGGVFSFDPTPSTEWCAVASDRLWTRDPERPWLVRASNVLTEGFAPSFNQFTGVEAHFEAPVRAFAEQEGVYYLLGQGGNQISQFHGDGPPPTTTGGWTDPVEVRTDLGCTAQETVVQIGDGVIFGTDRGPRLLTGGRVVTPFYEPVERYFLRYGQDISVAVYRQDMGDVVIATRANERADARRRNLRYNVTTQRWCSERHHNAIDAAASLAGEYAFMRWDGRAALGARTYKAGLLPLAPVFHTPWFRIDETMDPQQMLVAVQVLGDVLPEELQGQRIRIAMAYDYEEDYTDALAWDPSVPRAGVPRYATADAGHGTWGGTMGWGASNSTINASGLAQAYGRIQVTRPITRICQAVSVEVTLLPSDTPARGIDLAAIQVSLEYPDVPAQRFDQPTLLKA